MEKKEVECADLNCKFNNNMDCGYKGFISITSTGYCD